MTDFPILDLLRTQQASELCSHFEPSPAARELLAVTPNASFLLESLIARQLWRDAALMLAHGLQKRAAVWWACSVCREQLLTIEFSSSVASELAAIDCAERWVRDPQERYRQAACEAGAAAGSRAPAHWAAMAAFWATGNMTPDTGVVTSPPPFLYARAVVSAVEFAAARKGKQRDDFFRAALRRGISLASGGDGS
jgi:hypothetical protein